MFTGHDLKVFERFTKVKEGAVRIRQVVSLLFENLLDDVTKSQNRQSAATMLTSIADI